LPHIGIFDFTGVAFIGLLVALPYLWLVMPRLLPAHSSPAAGDQRKFFASLYIDAATTGDGVTLGDLQGKLGSDVRVYGITRNYLEMRRRDSNLKLEPGDTVQIEAEAGELRLASERAKASLIPRSTSRALKIDPAEDLVLAEVVIGADSSLIGSTVRSAQIADRYGAAVIGLYRPDRNFFHEALNTTDEELETGDVLLMQGSPERLKAIQMNEGAMVLEGAAELPRKALAPVALIIVAAVVITAALRIAPIAVTALAGTIAMIATGCVRFDRLGRALSGEVIVLVAASIALGRALLETGAAQWLGDWLAIGLDPLPPAGVLAAIMAFAALITNFSSNTAAAAVTTPIAVSIAAQLGVPAEPMVLAVLFGCNLSFATPVAYQTNILIMAAAGYSFKDFVRAGLPLVILMIITLSFALMVTYQL
jgi:di/tricarboxylate transporter